MRLDELAAAIGLTVPDDAARTPIEDLASDSRAIRPGSLFAALAGARADGGRFIADAVAAGAAAVLAASGTAWPTGVPARPLLLHDEPRRALAVLAALQAGAPPEQVVAITGTNGKTSTVEFLRQFWQFAGIPSASIGTLGVVGQPVRCQPAGYRSAEPGAGLTTPDSITLACLLAELASGGVRAAALEASSHGLSQFRLDGLRLQAAGFSNLTRDHLDYHGSLEHYRGAKLRLFEAVLPEGAIAAANADMDADTLAALSTVTAGRRQTLLLVGERGTTIRLRRARPLPDGQLLEIEALGRRCEIMLGLPGRFQADNVLLAAALADPEPDALDHTLQSASRLTGVRGRMERAVRFRDGACAYVDYAHTPDALVRLLTGLRPHALGRLIVVFGAGGDRDRGKRALMGAAASRLADVVIVTDDNPRSEPPASIRAEILAACPGATEIGNRAEAIAAGLEMLRAGDVLVVAGKGHEQGQTIAGETLPFDDRAVIRRLAGSTEAAA